MIRFPFNERKAAQAAAFLLRRHGGSYSYIGLLKLIYLADRKALIDTGLPITGDDMVCIKHGPVPSKTKDCLTGWQGMGEIWTTIVSRNENNMVRVLGTEEVHGQLSEYECDVLEEIDEKYGSLKPFELVELTHRECPEWQDPEDTSTAIDPAEILRHSGVTDERIAEIAAEAEELMRLCELGASGL